jgi:hypothetical protein
MKLLEKKFSGKGEVKGFKFKQVQKSNTAYIYEVNSGCNIYYEVFSRVVNTKRQKEVYPLAKHFSIWAWTQMNYEDAKKKFNQLNADNDVSN